MRVRLPCGPPRQLPPRRATPFEEIFETARALIGAGGRVSKDGRESVGAMAFASRTSSLVLGREAASGVRSCLGHSTTPTSKVFGCFEHLPADSSAEALQAAERVLQPVPAEHHGAKCWATPFAATTSPCSSSFPSLQSSTSIMEVGKTAALVERPRLQSYTNTHKKGRRAKEFVPYRHCRTGYPPARMFWSPGGEPRQRGRRRRA